MDPRACASNAQCAAGEICDLANGASFNGRGLGVGTCAPVRESSLCGGFGEGVCGCDGRTDRSPCEASQAGVRTGAFVPCGARAYPFADLTQRCNSDADCSISLGNARCDPALGACVPNHPLLACGFDGQCPADQRCCGYNAVCVDASVPELCQAPPPGSFFPCRTSSDCDALAEGPHGSGRYFCGGPGCGPGGGCFRPETGCTGVLDPVCGCNGMTYSSACWASADSARVAHAGTRP